jgi:hypothetical protein
MLSIRVILRQRILAQRLEAASGIARRYGTQIDPALGRFTGGEP